ncbi:uncharacterized protein CCR75_002981 [Bremia lactucae]|uniref:Uncharacterized protein n=1 Tax=Bremia lactucae TaxID=4779 RepID=A0A976ILK6_BRELC|nr:hypothetical protein CCR75_002981 [Bremia lactucae]
MDGCLEANMLTAYRGRTKDKSTQKWLDEWMAKLLHLAPHNLSSLFEILIIGNVYTTVVRLAHHIICAVIYGKEIRVLTGQEACNEHGVLLRLLRHLEALRSVTCYRDAFAAPNKTFDWFAVASLFSSAFEHGGAGSTRHY